jgi:methylglutaconyl-CoA hydratase
MMSDYTTIDFDVTADGVAVVILNRPEKRNALNAEVIAELSDVFNALAKTPEVRLVILRGAGPVFSAGADLEWMRAASDYTLAENEEDAFAMAEMLRRLNGLPQVTVAMLHGAAMAGAAGMVAACDIAIARQGTRFAFSEVRLGIIPATISPYVIAALGPRAARALFVTGEPFDADEAYRLGLVHYVVADETEMEAALERVAGLVFAASPAAIADAKLLVSDVHAQPIDASMSRLTANRLARRRVSEQGQEGLTAFLEKRKPSWSR